MVHRVPEQCRTAGAAEAPSDFFRRMIPGHVIPARDAECAARDVDGGLKMAGLFAAGGAVTGGRAGQVAGDGDADGTAEAGSFMHVRPPDPLPGGHGGARSGRG